METGKTTARNSHYTGIHMKKYKPLVQATEAEHAAMVRDIFSTITSGYDVMNRLVSIRRDVAWRRFAIKKISLSRKKLFLDVGTGTGDLAIEVAVHHPHACVVAFDLSGKMIDFARKKIEKRRLSGKIQLARADALAIPFRSNTFDAAGIAFGIRNIPDRIAVIKEMMRVIVPGGKIAVLEMGLPEAPLLRRPYLVYLNRVIPLVASLFSQNPDAYYYLGDSIANFPRPKDFLELMSDAGLVSGRFYPLFQGIAHLFMACKPKRGI